MFINEVVSVEDAPVMELGDEEMLFNDVSIFSLRISSVWDEANAFFIYFMGVTEVMSAGAGRDNLRCVVNSRETFGRRFVVLLDADAVLIFSASLFISWFIAVSFVSLLSAVFFYSRIEIFCAMD
jgi:hypothetical protein